MGGGKNVVTFFSYICSPQFNSLIKRQKNRIAIPLKGDDKLKNTLNWI